MATLRSAVSAWPCSSNAITITAAPYRRTSVAWRTNSSSPSLRLMELTTPLPWTHLRPASMTDHLDESRTTGTRLMSGSAAMSWRNLTMAARRIEHPLVHVHVDHLRAALHLLARDLEAGLVVAGENRAARTSATRSRWSARPRSRRCCRARS